MSRKLSASQRKARVDWCQANVGVLDDASKYYKKAKELWDDPFKAVSGWFGSGDYAIVSNSLIAGGTKAAMQPMAITNSRNGGETRIKFREYLGDVRTHPTTVGQWNNQVFFLNPGNFTTFPWFATIAAQYEQWTPNGIIFEFRSTATEYSTTVNLGSVVMATDYDVSDTDYNSKMEALNSAYSAESKVSTEVQYHGIECAPGTTNTRVYYVTTDTSVPTGTSRNDYFLGKFQIATVGSSGAANSIVGSLYVNYDITLRKPQFTQGLLGRTIAFDLFTLQGVVNAASPLGANPPIASPANRLGCSVQFTTLRFPPQVGVGLYRISWGGRVVSGLGNVTNRGPGVAYTNCTAVNPSGGVYWQTFVLGTWQQRVGVLSDFAGSQLVRITAPGATMTFNNGAGVTDFYFDGNTAFCYVEQVNDLEG